MESKNQYQQPDKIYKRIAKWKITASSGDREKDGR